MPDKSGIYEMFEFIGKNFILYLQKNHLLWVINDFRIHKPTCLIIQQDRLRINPTTVSQPFQQVYNKSITNQHSPGFFRFTQRPHNLVAIMKLLIPDRLALQ